MGLFRRTVTMEELSVGKWEQTAWSDNEGSLRVAGEQVLQDIRRVWCAALGRQFPEPLLAKVANYTCGWVRRSTRNWQAIILFSLGWMWCNSFLKCSTKITGTTLPSHTLPCEHAHSTFLHLLTTPLWACSFHVPSSTHDKTPGPWTTWVTLFF